MVEQSLFYFDEPAYSLGGTRGHLTSASTWLNGSSGGSPLFVTSHTGWNVQGEKAYTIDPKQNQNSAGHTADYSYSACGEPLLTGTRNALDQTVSAQYDCASGLLTSYTDLNAQTSRYTYDNMGRLLSMAAPDGGSTSFQYDDTNRKVTRTTLATPSPAQTLEVDFDGLGREVHRYASDPVGTVKVDTAYDVQGHSLSTTNPYRFSSDSTYGTNTIVWDAFGRKTNQVNADGSSFSWAYDGATVNSSDEALHLWIRASDALGRLTSVTEPGNALTGYTYDPVGNLLSVTQTGVTGEAPRTRSFSYDSLSRRAVRNVGTAVLWRFPRAVGRVGRCYRSTLSISPSFPPLRAARRSTDRGGRFV